MIILLSNVVFITGSDGFLGRNLVETCKKRNQYVVGFTRSIVPNKISDETIFIPDIGCLNWDEYLKKYRPKVIYHLATTASVADSVTDPLGDFNKNIPGLINLLISIPKYSPETHLILFSSAAVYGNPSCLPIAEDDICLPISPYGVNKYIAEKIAKIYSTFNKTRVSCLRIFSAFGEGLKRQLFYDLEQKLFLARSLGENEIVMFGTGDETRDFIHADDVSMAAILISDRHNSDRFSIFNVASGVQVKIVDAVNIYMQFSEKRTFVKFNGLSRSGDPKNWEADISKLRLLDFKPKVSLKEGLSRYQAWLISQ